MEWSASISKLSYAGSYKFFRGGGPNISEKFVPGGTNLRGFQIKRDSTFPRMKKRLVILLGQYLKLLTSAF